MIRHGDTVRVQRTPTARRGRNERVFLFGGCCRGNETVLHLFSPITLQHTRGQFQLHSRGSSNPKSSLSRDLIPSIDSIIHRSLTLRFALLFCPHFCFSGCHTPGTGGRVTLVSCISSFRLQGFAGPSPCVILDYIRVLDPLFYMYYSASPPIFVFDLLTSPAMIRSLSIAWQS